MNGRKVEARLNELGMSDIKLAATINISQGTVLNMKRSGNVSFDIVARAAKVLGLSLDDLADEDPPSEVPDAG